MSDPYRTIIDMGQQHHAVVVELEAEVERLRSGGLELDRVIRSLAADLEASAAEVERLRAAAKLVLEADMRGVRDLDALNALEDAAGLSQQNGT